MHITLYKFSKAFNAANLSVDFFRTNSFISLLEMSSSNTLSIIFLTAVNRISLDLLLFAIFAKTVWSVNAFSLLLLFLLAHRTHYIRA